MRKDIIDAGAEEIKRAISLIEQDYPNLGKKECIVNGVRELFAEFNEGKRNKEIFGAEDIRKAFPDWLRKRNLGKF